MKSYFIYIIKCSDNLLYTGFTNNIERRFNEHQLGLNPNCFTYKGRPLALIFNQEFNDVNQAIYFEKKIKKWSAEKKLGLAEENFDMMKILSECRNFTHSKNKPTKEEVSTASQTLFWRALDQTY